MLFTSSCSKCPQIQLMYITICLGSRTELNLISPQNKNCIKLI